MICEKCKKEFEEKEIQEHHLHPKFMDNPKGLGKKICLCKKCHDILHLKIASWIYHFKKNPEIIPFIMNKSLRFLKEGENEDTKTPI